MSVAFVEKHGSVVLARKFATITYKSGEDTFVRTMPVSEFRAFMALATQKLLEYDAAERRKVVPIVQAKKRASGH